MTLELVPGSEESLKPVQISKKEELRRSLLAEAKDFLDGWMKTRLTYFLHLWRNSRCQENDLLFSDSQNSSSEQSELTESETPDNWEELADDEKQEQHRRRRRQH